MGAACAAPAVDPATEVATAAAEVVALPWPAVTRDPRDASWCSPGTKIGYVPIDQVGGGGKRVMIKTRPVGEPKDSDFEIKTEPIPKAKEGHCVVKVIYVGMAPAMMQWMKDIDQFMPGTPVGGVVRATCVGQVVETSDPSQQAVGAWVSGLTGVQEYAVMPLYGCFPAVPDVPKTWNVSFFAGDAGLTSWIGCNILEPKAGKTYVVTAAASVTGAIVVQLLKARGATKVIGIAGGSEKCKWLKETLGADGVIDYKSESVSDRLGVLCGDGIDGVYDNVGGAMLGTILKKMNHFGTIVIGGWISGYLNGENTQAVENYEMIMARRLKVQGFLCFDHLGDSNDCWGELGGLVQAGKMQVKEEIVEVGIEQFAKQVNRMFVGDKKNFGKLIMKIAPEP